MMGLALAKLPDWPAALTRDEALAFTRVADTQLRAWEKQGKVHFRPRGANGAMIVRTVELEAALDDLFANDVGEDMEF